MLVKFYKSTASLLFRRTTNHHRLWGPPLYSSHHLHHLALFQSPPSLLQSHRLQLSRKFNFALWSRSALLVHCCLSRK